MPAPLKIVTWTLLGLVGLVLAGVLFLVAWINPNDYKGDITKAVKDKTGLVLAIDGNIGWTFWPAIGFSVEKVSLAPAEGAKPLASVGKAAVSVELLPLFSKQVNVRTLLVDNAVAELVVGTDGKGNWEALSKGAATPEAAKEEKPASAGGPLPTINVPHIVITNTVASYEDQRTNALYMLKIKEFTADNFSLDKEFPLHLVANANTNTKLDVDVDLKANVLLDLANETYGVRALDLKTHAGGILAQPFDATVNGNVLADLKKKQFSMNELLVQASGLALGPQTMSASLKGAVSADLGADTAKVGPLDFAVGNAVKGTLALDVKDLTKELSFAGTLTVPPFNAKNLMRDFGIAPPATTDPVAMTKVAVKTALAGTTKSAMLENLAITLDDSTITGKAGLTDLATKAIVFDLALDAINADRYLPPAAAAATPAPGGKATPAAPAAAPAPGGKPAPLLPVETLRTLNVDGKFRAGKVTAFELPMTSLALGVKAAGGNIVVDPVSAGVLEGTVRGDARIDARGAQPHITSNLVLDRIEVGGLVKRFAHKDLFTGKTSMKLNVDATGNDVDTLMKQASGNLDLSFADALIKGVNINNVLTDTLTQQLGAFAMLVPDYQQKLPKELQQDTALSTLAANATLKDGVATIPSLKAGIKDGDVKGSGTFNIVSHDFDYQLAVHTARLKDSKYFANAEFPVRCKGNIAGSASDWCRPDSKAIGEMLKKAAKGAATDRLTGAISEKLGIDASALGAGSDATDTKAAKKEAKKKAKEELNKQLEKALNKYQ